MEKKKTAIKKQEAPKADKSSAASRDALMEAIRNCKGNGLEVLKVLGDFSSKL